MEITKDTDLSEILNNSEVIETISEYSNTAIGKISDRTSALSQELSGTIKGVLVEGNPVYYEEGEGINSLYSGLSEDLQSAVSSGEKLAVEQERKELKKLQKCVNDYIEELEGKITQYNQAIQAIESSSDINVATKESEKAAIRNEITLLQKEKENYENKLKEINERISKVINVMSKKDFVHEKRLDPDAFKEYKNYKEYLDAAIN